MLDQFSRTELLLGKEKIEKLSKTKVAVFGIGGVGSFVVEGLVRAGVGKFVLVDDNLEWYCPNCGNRDHNTLNVARRTCGYIGSNFWNKGRTEEIKERVLHIDKDDKE